MFPIPKIYVYVTIILAIYGFGFWSGYKIEKAFNQAAINKAQREVALIEERQQDVSNQVAEEALIKQSKIQFVTKEIIKEIPKYVPRETDMQCNITHGVVRMLNQASSGSLSEVSQSTAKPNDASAEIKLSDLTIQIADNYGTCNATRQQLLDLQEWILKQQSIK